MDIIPFLNASCCTEAFKADVLAFANHDPAPRMTLARPAPRVKVLRVLANLLVREPQIAVDRARVDAVSGCADFVGTLVVEADGQERRFEFVWDCHWRAQQEGWTDCFGFPDQIRAAQTFGWDCFMSWKETEAAVAR